MEKPIIQRIKSIIDFYNIPDLEFAKRIGMPQTTISNIFKRNSDIKYPMLEKIINSFGDISPNWLMTGKGDMLKQEEAPVITSNSHIIKYYPSISGSMGGVAFLDDPNEQRLDIVLPNFNDCQYAINVQGDSMYPLIKSGQIIILKEWKENFIEWGKIYLVITKSGYRTVKYLKHGSDDKHIKCVSENKENEPFEIEYSDVTKMFLVKGWICKDAM